jgi:hypothetical protein
LSELQFVYLLWINRKFNINKEVLIIPMLILEFYL